MHENNGACEGCQTILDRYPNFHEDLRNWFEEFQADHPEAHISCAGRGKIDQNSLFQRGASRARYGDSAHNWNCAVDLFEMQGNGNIYEKSWFNSVLKPNLPPYLLWYGNTGSVFYELPHVEIKSWRRLRDDHLISLVE